MGGLRAGPSRKPSTPDVTTGATCNHSDSKAGLSPDSCMDTPEPPLGPRRTYEVLGPQRRRAMPARASKISRSR